MKQNIYEFALKELKDDRPVVFATIIKRRGSSPRGAGAFMVVTKNGRIQGTIGGGKLEATIRENLAEYLAASQSHIIDFHLSESDAADLDMICGGNVSVLVESIFPEQTGLVNMVAAMKETTFAQHCGWLVSKLPPAAGGRVEKAFIQPDGVVTGSLAVQAELDAQQLVGLVLPEGKRVDAPGLTINRQAQLFAQEAQGIFLEPVGQFSKVFLIGAGHVAQKVALLTPAVGFKTIVLDDRADYLSQERFPLADETIALEDFSGVFADLTIDVDSSVVIVTRGHASDREVLKQALQTDAGYVGMLGSRRKIRATFDILMREGVSQQALDKVHTPIGLSIGAETPEEIAISIVAELIQARAESKQLKTG